MTACRVVSFQHPLHAPSSPFYCWISNRSIAAGVAALPDDTDVVVVHDAVRPFVDADTMARVAIAAHQHGAGM